MRLTRTDRIIVGLAVILGVVLRVWILRSRLGPIDSDEAVVGLMARHLLHHGELRTFFWGQQYGSIHEMLGVAGLELARVPVRVAMEAVPLALHAVGVVLVWRIGLRLASARAAAIAAALFWATSAPFIWESTKERAFYGAVLVFGLAALLLALRLDTRASRRDAISFGLAVGSAWYASPQAIYLLVPIGIWLLSRRSRALLNLLPLGLAGAVAAASPWIYTNAHTGFASLTAAASLPHTTFWFRLKTFFEWGLPVALGLKRTIELTWLFPGAKVAYVIAVGIAVLAVLRFAAPIRPVLAVIAVYPVVYALLPTSFYFADPRYLYLLWPAACLVSGWLAGSLPPAARFGAVAVMLVVTVLGVDAMTHVQGRYGDRPLDVVPPDVGPTIAFLDAHHQTRVFGDYWLAHRITWVTDERIVVAPLQLVRYAPYERIVRREARNPWYLLPAGGCYDERFQVSLALAGIQYRRVVLGGEVAVIEPAVPVRPERGLGEWARARGRTDVANSC